MTGGKNGEIALIAEKQKLFFDSFTTSTGITYLTEGFTKEGSILIKGENKFGNNQASLNIIMNLKTNKISAEYEDRKSVGRERVF